MDNLTIIGHTELIDLPKQNIVGVPAKTDTGADTSAIWASNIREAKDGLRFVLFDVESEFYTGEELHVPINEFSEQVVINSFGVREERYKIKLTIEVRGRRVKTTFTLANRENNRYPVLLGRRMLSNKFVVDVRQRAVDIRGK